MSELKKAVKFYDAIAETFDQEYYGPKADPAIAFDVHQVWQILSREIRSEDRVLEVGCGTGYWIEKITQKITPNVYGFDFSIEMLRIAKSRNCRLLVLSEAADLPFMSGVFDKVISPFNALNHCPSFERAFSEIRRVLKIGGKALLMVDNKQRLISTYWNFSHDKIHPLESDPRSGNEVWRHLVNGYEVGVFSHFFTKEEIVDLMKKFELWFLGIGTISPLLPRFLRRHARIIFKILLWIAKPLENFFTYHWPTRAAHLFIIAKKISD